MHALQLTKKFASRPIFIFAIFNCQLYRIHKERIRYKYGFYSTNFMNHEGISIREGGSPAEKSLQTLQKTVHALSTKFKIVGGIR